MRPGPDVGVGELVRGRWLGRLAPALGAGRLERGDHLRFGRRSLSRLAGEAFCLKVLAGSGTR
jgi:hypothetical protein